MLTHRNVMHTLITNTVWFNVTQNSSQLAVLPFFHVTSMQGCMNGPLYQGTRLSEAERIHQRHRDQLETLWRPEHRRPPA